ncbi:hypothetical protein ACIA8R_44025 [Nonomuraea sp. NPDC051191]|uniref:hypothetical protein n=1 Tax=Nonomuraea sp. NPDC051191 TaxID=3364372 RepID=UPI0037BAE541
MSPVPTIGRIVHYQLADEDADDINRRRDDYEAFQRGRTPALPGQPGRDGHVAHVGTRVIAGDIFPAMVVRAYRGAADVNLQVHLDGNDTYWVTSSVEGDRPGTWHWPPRV